jgi:hypothetical protein
MSYKDLEQNKNKELLVDDKMNVIDGLSSAEKDKALRDKKWVKRNLRQSERPRVFIQQMDNDDVKGDIGWERKHFSIWQKDFKNQGMSFENYLKKNA